MEERLIEPHAQAGDTVAGKLTKGEPNDPLQSPEKAMDHAWRYFALHAQQRMSVFNFFVVLSGILATGICAGLQVGKPTAPVTAILGALLALFASVFQRLDKRGAHLVKLAEDALAAGEVTCMPPYARVVAFERTPTSEAGEGSWTFGTSFRFIFRTMGAVGFAACLLSIYRMAT